MLAAWRNRSCQICSFCTILRDGLFPITVSTDEFCFVPLDRQSLAFGHCMVIPRTHVRSVYELDPDTHQGVFSLAKRPAPRLARAAGRKAVGYVALGTGLPHAHLHLVPMDAHEVLLQPEPAAVSDDTLADWARQL
jgi:histidine triad (HIT) family protein